MSMKKHKGGIVESSTNEAGLDLKVPMGVSGAFLHDTQRFAEISTLSAEYRQLSSRLRKVEYDLNCCNYPAWLQSFEKQCRRLKRDPNLELRRRAEQLEEQKSFLIKQLDDTRTRLHALEPTALEVHHTLSGLVPSNRRPEATSVSSRRENSDVAARNAVIDSLLDQPALGICSELDDRFPANDRPAAQFVDSWFRKFAVKAFIQAYNHEQCRRLVHTLISKRRKLRGYLDASG